MDHSLAIGIAVFAGFVFSIVVHECAHAIVASWLGDDTARLLGRITLNPIPHIDPFMSIILPGALWLGSIATGTQPILFGGAKPVPVDMNNLRGNRLVSMMWVALAGPISNILLAFGFALAMNLIPLLTDWSQDFAAKYAHVLLYLVFSNIALALFNMIPVPPLDGSRVLAAILPKGYGWYIYQYGHLGMLLVAILVFSGGTSFILKTPLFYSASWVFQLTSFGDWGEYVRVNLIPLLVE